MRFLVKLAASDGDIIRYVIYGAEKEAMGLAVQKLRNLHPSCKLIEVREDRRPNHSSSGCNISQAGKESRLELDGSVPAPGQIVSGSLSNGISEGAPRQHQRRTGRTSAILPKGRLRAR